MANLSREHARSLLNHLPPLMHWLRSEVRKAMPEELTLLQFRILSNLDRGVRTTSQLSERMGITLPALSRAIDGMVRKDWIQRKPSTEDRRTIQLALTSKGRVVFRQTQSQVESRLGVRLEEMGASQSTRFGDGVLAILELQALLNPLTGARSAKTRF